MGGTKVQEELAIQKVINTYSQAASLGEWDRALATYLPDAVWDIPNLGMKLEGRDAIRSTLIAFMDTMDYVLQINTPALIEVSGDTATARSGIRECGKTKGKEEGFEFLGMYVDRLVRTAEGWKFEERIFDGIGTHYFPLVAPEQG